MKPASLAVLALVLLPAAGSARADTLVPFHTPSGNIHCMAVVGDGGSLVDCEVLEMTSGPLLPRPKDCDLDWGHRFMVGVRTRGEMVCAGDTVRDPNGMVLNYGSSSDFGDITCTSSERGLECR